MPNIKNNASAQETRRRLMEAASELFAERGLHATTVKEITDRAGVNTAAINYHFSDKYELYAAVIRQIVDTEAPRLIPETIGTGPAPERLRRFVRAFMRSLLTKGTAASTHILLAREMAEPTACFDYMLQGFAVPLEAIVEPLVRELLGPEAGRDDIDLAVASIFGQCLHYPHSREMIAKLHPALAHLGKHDIDRIADHITDASLAALEAQRGRLQQQGRGSERGSERGCEPQPTPANP